MTTTQHRVICQNRPRFVTKKDRVLSSVVFRKNVTSDAMEVIHQKMVDARGQVSDLYYYGSQPSPSPAQPSLKRPA